ncbi:MAG: hypothetical protein ABEJ77_00650 [Halanaeroarchaeum sp.]
MKRRRFLATAGALGTAGLAGCSSALDWRSSYAPPVVEDRPRAVYYPSHVEGMDVIGTKTAGGYGCALFTTYPHRFWLVTGSHTQRVSIESEDSMHLMVAVWDTETGIVVPDASPAVRVTVGDRHVTTVNPWSMLSQPMGLHFGANVTLPAAGEYAAQVDLSPPSIARHGSMPRGPASPVTCTFPLSYSRAALRELPIRRFPEKKGTRGAVDPMPMPKVPDSQVPEPAALPGTPLGTGTSGDAAVAVRAIPDARPFGGTAEETYLAVSPRTPYNRYQLPFASLSASVERAGRTIADERLAAGVHPDLSVHYGTTLEALDPGDRVTVEVDTPPQMSRHEGYETAFLSMDEIVLER